MKAPTFDELAAAITLTGDLERDNAEQSSFYFQAGIGAARAAADADDAKYALSQEEARCQESIRQLATTTSEKVTESLVTARVQVHPSYVKANTTYLAAKRKAREWEALCESFDARQRSLYNLTLLSNRGVDSSSIGYEQMRKEAAARRATDARKPLVKRAT